MKNWIKNMSTSNLLKIAQKNPKFRSKIRKEVESRNIVSVVNTSKKKKSQITLSKAEEILFGAPEKTAIEKAEEILNL